MPSKPNQALSYDTLDDRKEVEQLLKRLTPTKRLAWLRRCCARATLGKSAIQPRVPPDHKGSALEVYFDFWGLLGQYNVDPKPCLADLVDTVKGKTR